MKCFFLIPLFFFQVLNAQSLKIDGHITDINKKPLEFVTVALFKDTVYINAAISDSVGYYSLNKVSSGDYKIAFSYIGFSKFDTSLHINKDFRLDCSLLNDIKTLDEVTIRSRKPRIERKVDRLIFNIENSTMSIGLDALEAIGKAPGVRVKNDMVSLIGKSSVSIMINDKMIQLSGSDLAAYLKSFRAEDISKIEIITNPSAKYDAEGNSGVINIVIKKINKQGLYADMRLSTTKTTFYGYNSGSTIQYFKNKVRLLSSMNIYQGGYLITGLSNTDYPFQKWENLINQKNFTNGYNARMGIEYQWTPKTSIEIQSYVGNSLPHSTKTDKISIFDNVNTMDSLIISNAQLKETTKNKTTGLHLQHAFDTLGKKMVFDADWLGFTDGNSNAFMNNNFLPNGQKIIGSNETNLLEARQNIKLYTLQSDFDFPNKTFNFSFGGKLSFFRSHNSLDFYQLFNNDYKIIGAKSDKFQYKENTQAFYVNGNKEMKKWGFQLGIRVENTNTEGVSQLNNQKYLNNYLRLFPSFSISYISNDKNTFSLNCNKRIDRPSYSLLNPFRDYSTIYTYSEGNPFLKPSIINNFEIGHTFNNFLNTTLSYSREIDKFDVITFLNDSSNIQASTYLNYLTGRSVGLNLSATLHVAEWLESINQFSLNYISAKSSIAKTIAQLKGFNPYFSSNNEVLFNKSKTLTGSCEVEYQLPYIDGLDRSGGYFMIHIGFKMTALKRKLQILIAMNDVLKTGKPYYYTFYDNIKKYSQYYFDNRQLKIAFSYKIGKDKDKKEERQSSNSDELQRIKQ
jgi:Outer membrane protein beta-barrel family/CarboxypepD_reg-like domain